MPRWKEDRVALLGGHIAACLRAASSDKYLQLDAFMRAPRVEWYLEADLKTNADAPPFPQFGAGASAPLGSDHATFTRGLASMHRDGRIREKYVTLLAADPSPQAIPFLLVRTADWVPQVALPAHEAIARRLADNAAPFARSAALIAQLAQMRRGDPALAHALGRALGKAESATQEAFAAAAVRDRRALLGLAADMTRVQRRALAAAGLADNSDIKLRLAAARILLDPSDGEIPVALIRTLTRDRSGPVAALALEHCVAAELPDLRAILTDALFHPARLVSSYAGALMRRHFAIAPATILRRELVPGGVRQLRALKGLVTFGNDSDVKAALALMPSREPSLAAMAFRLIAEHAAPTHLDLIIARLVGPRATQRIAIGALRRHAASIETSVLTPFLDHPDPTVAHSVFAILLTKGSWISLEIILHAHAIVALRAEAQIAFDRWLARLGRSGGRPDRAAAAAIAARLDASEGSSPEVLPRATRDLVRQLIA